MPLTGLEPVRYRYRGILSPLCLPIPPQRLTRTLYNQKLQMSRELILAAAIYSFELRRRNSLMFFEHAAEIAAIVISHKL